MMKSRINPLSLTATPRDWAPVNLPHREAIAMGSAGFQPARAGFQPASCARASRPGLLSFGAFAGRMPARRAGSPRSPKRRASVLIVVLWACLGLVSVALLFGHSMLMTYRGADNDFAGRQAEQAIEGAARYALTLFSNLDKPGEMPDVTGYVGDAVPVGEATFWFIGRPAETSTGLTREFGLVDEASKLNLNTATPGMLANLPGMTDELAAAIADWVDDDENVRTNGAESETYMQKQPGYSCKNKPFESIAELALVNGATRAILYGEDANMNGVLDPNEDDGDKTPPADNSDGKLDPGILEYVTVFSQEATKQSDGTTDRTSVSDRDALEKVLTDTFPAPRGQAIVDQLPPPGSPPFQSVLDVFFRTDMMDAEFEQIADKVMAGTPTAPKAGLVNVNTASEAVLACIPGIGVDMAATLVATRSGRTQPDISATWVKDAINDPARLAQAAPFLTSQSWQWSVDVAAVGRHGRGYRRSRFVVDNSTGTPRIIYRRNLAPLGWALGSEIRQNLATTKSVR